jgi:hypothetical protein
VGVRACVGMIKRTGERALACMWTSVRASGRVLALASVRAGGRICVRACGRACVLLRACVHVHVLAGGRACVRVCALVCGQAGTRADERACGGGRGATTAVVVAAVLKNLWAIIVCFCGKCKRD